MKVRTLTLTACALATALLLPALQTGAAAEPGSSGKKAAPSPSPSVQPSPPAPPACAVQATAAVGAAGGPVLESATLENEPTVYPVTAGYYVKPVHYPGSSTFQATIDYAPPTGGGCGSISLLTYPVVVVNGADVVLDSIQARTVHLSGDATSVSITSLVVGLPANSKKDASGLCVGSRLEVRDAAGALSASYPAATSAPLVFCPEGGGGRTYI